MKKLLLATLAMGILTGCSGKISRSLQYEQKENNAEIVQRLIETTPIPKIERSLERENVARRITFINNADRVGYLYLITNNGQLINEVQVKGKVSSLNSYLTPMNESYGSYGAVVDSADVDGTWGENDAGIFWFTPDGVYQEWTGLYMYSSERMSFQSQPILTEVVDNE